MEPGFTELIALDIETGKFNLVYLPTLNGYPLREKGKLIQCVTAEEAVETAEMERDSRGLED